MTTASLNREFQMLRGQAQCWHALSWMIVSLGLLAQQVYGATYYVAPGGDDTAAGTLESPWKTVSHAADMARAGDVIYLRGGTYLESDIRIDTQGTAESPIKIVGYPSEKPIIDGGMAEFRTAGNHDWEIVDRSKGVFRSSKAYPDMKQVLGTFADGSGVDLVPYLDYETLCTDNEDFTEQAPYFYMGPGVFWNPKDSRIYIRLKGSMYQRQPRHATSSQLDPRQVPLRLFSEGTLVRISGESEHLVIEGLQLCGRKALLEYGTGAHHVELRDCRLESGRYQIVVRDGAHDLVFDHLVLRGGMPDWVPRSDVKRPRKTRPGQVFQGAGIDLEERVANVEVRNCSFEQLFDGIDTHVPVNLSIHHNRFEVIRDDAIEVGSGGYDVDIAHNRLLVVAAGISWSGNGCPPTGKIGTKYIHHNLIVTSVPMLYGRRDPSNLLESGYAGPKGDGMATGRAFGMHSKGDIKGPDPWKIYHNTIVGGEDADHEGIGAAYEIRPFDAAFPHEVYNNIFVQVAASNFVVAARVADGSQIFDGNLYYRPARYSTTPEFVLLDSGGHTARFNTLSQFRASSLWGLTLAYYRPGWEASGIEADPQLDQQFVPAKRGPANTAGVDLRSKKWPGIDGAGFRGAFAGATRAPGSMGKR